MEGPVMPLSVAQEISAERDPIEYDDLREPQGPHATMGPLQLTNWKRKAARAMRFYHKTVQVFKKKLEKYEQIYNRNLEKIDTKVTGVKDKFSKVGEKFANVSQKLSDKYEDTVNKISEKYEDTVNKISNKYNNTVTRSLKSIKDKIGEYDRFIREKYNLEEKKQAYDNFVESMRAKAKEIENKFLNLPQKMVDTYHDIKSYAKKDKHKGELAGPEKRKAGASEEDFDSREEISDRRSKNIDEKKTNK